MSKINKEKSLSADVGVMDFSLPRLKSGVGKLCEVFAYVVSKTSIGSLGAGS